MRVTITLGKKALEYVTGIPEDELPEILSDVLERSLEQQVSAIPSSDKPSSQGEDILSQIKEMLKLAQINPASLNTRNEETTVDSKPRKTTTVDSTPLIEGGDLDGWEELLK